MTAEHHISINGKFPVSEVMISMPLSGLWVATASLVTRETLPRSVTLYVGSTRWTGVTDMVGDYAGQTSFRVVGGGLVKTTIPSGFFSGVGYKAILADACARAGVTLQTSITEIADSWVRTEGTAAQEIERVALATGYTWRATKAGVIWVGTDSWPDIKPVPQIRFAKPSEKMREYFTDEPTLTPGSKVDGFSIVHAVFFGSQSEAWTRVYHS